MAKGRSRLLAKGRSWLRPKRKPASAKEEAGFVQRRSRLRPKKKPASAKRRSRLWPKEGAGFWPESRLLARRGRLSARKPASGLKKPAFGQRSRLLARRSRLSAKEAGFWPEEAGFFGQKPAYAGLRRLTSILEHVKAGLRRLTPASIPAEERSRLTPAYAGSFLSFGRQREGAGRSRRKPAPFLAKSRLSWPEEPAFGRKEPAYTGSSFPLGATEGAGSFPERAGFFLWPKAGSFLGQKPASFWPASAGFCRNLWVAPKGMSTSPHKADKRPCSAPERCHFRGVSRRSRELLRGTLLRRPRERAGP